MTHEIQFVSPWSISAITALSGLDIASIVLALATLVAAGLVVLAMVPVRRRQAWRRLAREAGLRLEEVELGFVALGHLDGRAIRLDAGECRGASGSFLRDALCITIHLRGLLPHGLRIEGSQHTRSLDTDLDGEFAAQGLDPERLRDWLTPVRRRALSELARSAACSDVVLAEDRLTLEFRPALLSTGDPAEVLALARRAAAALDGPDPREYDTVEDVERDDWLTPDEEVDLLRQLAYDARELEVAAEEGMWGGEPSDYAQVARALAERGADDVPALHKH